ncbi:hypothetical protein ACTOB_004432 [Actinoplanes oblitus]|uniref:Uncharacterized protein n=1 Tax=Actinoplanes oblitus TaxID=3040509 RepID=A0ABY8W9T4_9ACTN|nr:hypothetical protein [Actinoplanes oblitus]WIM92490.1 hypothetical protein ACTOB_004432 [Actinoplanes oblitus]
MIALGSIAVVSAIAVVRDWDFDSWMRAVAMCALAGVMSAVTEAGRNRRLDRSARQARAIDDEPASERSPR